MAGALSIGTWATLGALPRLLLTWLVISCLAFTTAGTVHCKENPIYVFLSWELRSLSTNFHIHVSVSDLYFPRIGPHISCGRIDRSLTDKWKWKLGLWPHNSFMGIFVSNFRYWFLLPCKWTHLGMWLRDGGKIDFFITWPLISMVFGFLPHVVWWLLLGPDVYF
jgi:hypothetical protein